MVEDLQEGVPQNLYANLPLSKETSHRVMVTNQILVVSLVTFLVLVRETR